jgi:hypothetical protein
MVVCLSILTFWLVSFAVAVILCLGSDASEMGQVVGVAMGLILLSLIHIIAYHNHVFDH